MNARRLSAFSLLFVLLSVLGLSCAQEELPLSVWNERHPAATPSPTRDGGVPAMIGTCRVPNAEAMPATLAAMAGGLASSTAGQGTTTEIYAAINASCNISGCHNTAANAFFVTGPADLLLAGGEGFATQGEWAIAHIEGDFTQSQTASKTPCALGSSATCETMPLYSDPTYGGKTWTMRMASSADPIVKLDGLLRAWLAGGKTNTFSVGSADAGAVDGGSPYAIAGDVGAAMTNLGSCVPDTSLMGADPSTMDSLDQAFAAMQRAPVGNPDQTKVVGLPPKLSMTDLTTFDSDALARTGVIAYVPQYPLWSDDAAKLRMVRVPRGQSIRFDKNRQEFNIPANTRFYKTFAKRIIDSDGNVSYRKIETRLIVSRPEGPWDGVSQPASLYGAYRWTKDEKEAYLEPVSDPTLFDSLQPTGALHDGTGFTDDMFEYDIDYPAVAELTAAWGGNIESQNATLLTSRLRRTYAMPSSTRCIQCHTGSPGRSFVLGFRPVQIVHRPVGQGGVIESSGTDEMTQLQRLIGYGVISGVDSAEDILPLENSEAPRTPRNEHELIAQGYLLGNCSHCHNPNGYASVTFPQLKNVLNFVPGPGPDAPTAGGIFQFPLEWFSPRIFRGQVGSVQVPYITPSLQDNPSYPTDLDPFKGDYNAVAFGYEPAFLPKWREPEDYLGFVYAPWRSLIYRNTDTAFTYADDYTIYPHMPMNTPGFDCRAKQILGDWMVSIPARRKQPDLAEYGWPYDTGFEQGGVTPAITGSPPAPSADLSSQPYVEVFPGDPAYAQALTDTEARLAIFHSGVRPGGSGSPPSSGPDQQWFGSRFYACPDTSDVVDPTFTGCTVYPTENESAPSPEINVPTHSHWAALDLTHSTSGWSIRDQSWESDLVMQSPAAEAATFCSNVTALGSANTQRQAVTDLLAGAAPAGIGASPADAGANSGDASVAPTPVTLSAGVSWNPDAGPTIRDLFEEQLPLGLWQENATSQCDWSKAPNVKTVAEVTAKGSGVPDMAWLHNPKLDHARHVYMQTMGYVVFNEICINCHGQNADSRGRLADNLANITGGKTVVADFKDGLFGPTTNPGANRRAKFGDLDAAPPPAPDGGNAAAWLSQWESSWHTPLQNVLLDGSAGALDGWVNDWGARYMGYMALGGTHATINAAFLGIVAHTPFLGAGRDALYIGTSEGANMLAVGRELCGAVLRTPAILNGGGNGISFLQGHFDPASVHDQFLFDNADAEVWLRLCTLNNPPPVIGYEYDGPAHFPAVNDNNGTYVLSQNAFSNPPNGGFVVGDQDGIAQTSLTAANMRPWCVTQNLANASPPPPCLTGSPGAGCIPTPICPKPFAKGAPDPSWIVLPGDVVTQIDPITQWKLRGAINAGLAVFVYLDDLTRSTTPQQPTFDHCDQLGSTVAGDGGQ